MFVFRHSRIPTKVHLKFMTVSAFRDQIMQNYQGSYDSRCLSDITTTRKNYLTCNLTWRGVKKDRQSDSCSHSFRLIAVKH